MAAAGYTALWEFAVAPAKQTEFEEHYGPDGTWANSLTQYAYGELGQQEWIYELGDLDATGDERSTHHTTSVLSSSRVMHVSAVRS